MRGFVFEIVTVIVLAAAAVVFLIVPPQAADNPGGAFNRTMPDDAEPGAFDGCIITGCSGQLCAGEETITTCEWREAYACYRNARCERQTNGECGWTQTVALQHCLAQAGGV